MFVLAEHLDGLFSLLKHYRTVAISLEVKCSACEISRDGSVGGCHGSVGGCHGLVGGCRGSVGAICNVWKDRKKKQEKEGKLSNTGKINTSRI